MSNLKSITNNSIQYFNKVKKEGRKEMEIQRTKSRVAASLSKVILILIMTFSILAGCSDSNLTGVHQNNSNNTSAGQKPAYKKFDTTIIQLDMNLRFKSEVLTESKMLESNNNNHFNNIVPISLTLKPNEVLDLQELQPNGIFGLYLSSTGTFVLSNYDGMSLNSKTILLEKCAFIDLKLRNIEAKEISIQGFVAGE